MHTIRYRKNGIKTVGLLILGGREQEVCGEVLAHMNTGVYKVDKEQKQNAKIVLAGRNLFTKMSAHTVSLHGLIRFQHSKSI